MFDRTTFQLEALLTNIPVSHRKSAERAFNLGHSEGVKDNRGAVEKALRDLFDAAGIDLEGDR